MYCNDKRIVVIMEIVAFKTVVVNKINIFYIYNNHPLFNPDIFHQYFDFGDFFVISFFYSLFAVFFIS